MDYSNLFVCLMGICTVFIGLICIIILVSVMSYICRKTDKAFDAAGAKSVPVKTVSQAVTAETVAAVAAAIAEELGTDVSAIRIVSMKRI